METPSGIENKVATSGLVQLDMASFVPVQPLRSLDIAAWLWEGIALREKEFRQHIKEHNWAQYAARPVAVYCSSDALIPQWAYMLVAVHLQPHTTSIYFAPPEAASSQYILECIQRADLSDFEGKRVVLKGCGQRVDSSAYGLLAMRLSKIVQSLMFGEPCSTVPIYKRR